MARGTGGETEARLLLGRGPGRPGGEVSGPPVRALSGELGPTRAQPVPYGQGQGCRGPWGFQVLR